MTTQSTHMRTKIIGKPQKWPTNNLNTQTPPNQKCEEIKMKNSTLTLKDIVNQNTTTFTDQTNCEQISENENSQPQS